MRIPSWFLMILVGFVVVVTAAAAIFTYTNVRQFTAEAPLILSTLPNFGSSGSTRPTAVPLVSATQPPTVTSIASTAQDITPQSAQPGTSAAVAPAGVQSSPAPAVAPLDSPTRITILLLGIDQRKGETGSFRTDTMMLLSVDPARKTAAMLSVPRDIYIQIPGYQPNRINTAYDIGERMSYPGGGAMLSVKTVQRLLGVPIQHYVLINFDVFAAVIDAIGPVRVCPDKAIHDDKYPDGSYGYITVDFQPGCQDLDSTRLLQYARVRHNAGDDFGRAQRQQEVIKAVRDKILSLGGVSSLLTKAGTIWDAVKTSVKTDMTLDQMLQLGQFAQSIPKENIKSAVLTDKDNYLMPSKTTEGEDVFTPVYEKIHDLMEQLFDAAPVVAANATTAPNPTSAATSEAIVQPTTRTITQSLAQATTQPTSLVQPTAVVQLPTSAATAATSAASDNTKNAVVQVSNGAGVDGLGKQTVDKLRAKGFNVLDPKNADLPGGYAQTVIKVYTGKTGVARALATALGVSGSTIVIGDAKADNMPNVDIQVIVGKDLAPPGK